MYLVLASAMAMLTPHPLGALASRVSKDSELRRARKLRTEADRHYEEENYGAATPLAKQACSILREQLGEESLEHVECMNDLAVLYVYQGMYQEAKPLLIQSLAISEKILGPRHPDVATSLANLASLHVTQGNYKDAEPLHLRARAIIEETLGPEHPQLADSLNDLAHLYMEIGRYAEACTTYQRALDIHEKSFGPNDRSVARTLNSLADAYMKLGEHEKAQPLLERARSITEERRGSAHPSIAPILGNLASLHKDLGEFDKAEALHLRALSIREAALEENHPDIATSLNNLASLHEEMGQYDLAEPLYQRALTILESSLGRRHPRTAGALNNIASHYHRLGEYEKAQALYEEALAILKDRPGNSSNTASIMNNLGALHLAHKRYLEAEHLLEEALQITKKTVGLRHQSVAISLNNLASLYQQQGAYGRAEPLYEQALAIRTETLGSKHPQTAASLHNSASLFVLQGKRDEAWLYYSRALVIFEEAFGIHHPQVAITLRGMGSVKLSQGADQLDHAISLFRRAADIDERSMAQTLTFAAESRRLEHAATFLRSTNHLISVHLQLYPEHSKSANLALTTLLRRKGRVQELAGQTNADIRRILPQEHHELLNTLAKTQNLYATLSHRGPGKLAPETFSKRLAELQLKQDEIWRTIAKITNRAVQTEQISISDIQTSLPHDAALIEYVKYRPSVGPLTRGTNEDRYAAYIILPHRFDWVDLGVAEAIDDQAHAFTESIIRRDNTNDTGQATYRSVMQPIVKRIGLTTRLFISPDGNLNILPFDALVDEYGNYLMERFYLHYLTSGRDLLRPWMLRTAAVGPMLVIANPTGADLPGTEREASLLTSLFSDAISVQRNEATEGRLRAQERPRALHVATHGTFGAGHWASTISANQQNEISQWNAPVFERSPHAWLDNPMLYSWLDLAPSSGASAEGELADDGRLTAYEISGLDLRGTELVTLSACDTAHGEYQEGEGVLGLRRAFAVAGAQTQIMSLWKVSDTATIELMESYYHRLLRGEGRSEAMRNTQLEMLRHPETRHPRDWAAFVVIGEWSPLSNTPRAAQPFNGPPRVRQLRGCQSTIGGSLSPSALGGLVVLALLRRRRRRSYVHK